MTFTDEEIGGEINSKSESEKVLTMKKKQQINKTSINEKRYELLDIMVKKISNYDKKDNRVDKIEKKLKKK